MDCELCNPASQQVLWRDGFCRVVMIDQPDYPGYCSVNSAHCRSSASEMHSTSFSRTASAVTRIAFMIALLFGS